MTLSIDDAVTLFVQKLRTAPALSVAYDDPSARHTTEGCDVRVEGNFGIRFSFLWGIIRGGDGGPRRVKRIKAH